MTISLNSHQEKFVAEQVANGQFNSPDHVVRIALCLFESQSGRAAVSSKSDARQKIEEGLSALDRGEFLTKKDVDAEIQSLSVAWRAANT